MDGTSGATTFDKSRVLDVKPLRTLVPMFPSPPQAPPFVCSSPFGPFAPGFSPFYPFTQGNQNATENRQTRGGGSNPSRAANQEESFPSPSSAVPLRSFGTPHMGAGVHFSGASNGDADESIDMSSGGGKKRAAVNVHGSSSSSQKKKKVRAPADGVRKVAENIPGLTLSPAQQEVGNSELVNYVMLKFDAVRRRISQLEDSNEAPSGSIRRADLTSGKIMMSAGIRTNNKKKLGIVPGVEIGDIFFFRMEMCVVGLHAQSMGGIDYMSVKSSAEEEPLAVSVVSAGAYDDDADNADFLIYTGHGGNFTNKTKALTDQKLVRGNLALDRSSYRGNEIRVIRGIRDSVHPAMRIYVYDGLYIIKDSWVDKGQSGASSFKYKMVRVPGQPPAFSVWQSIQKFKQGISSREGLILPDLTSGAETIPVSLVNDVDDEKGPSYFTYTAHVKHLRPFGMPQASLGCNCKKDCSAGDLNCGCVRKNGGDSPYTANGVLVSRKPVVYECGASCSCSAVCKNRVSQIGIRVRLEVFKTNDRGWGLRSWDPIRAGTFICEYAGQAIDKAVYDRDNAENAYVFDTSRSFDSSFKWNYDPELIVGDTPGDICEGYNIPSPLVINAKDVGNVARFMNHSCSPNVFWQPISYEQNGEYFLHVAFFAIRHIPPMTELTYDYGMSQAGHRRKQCLCGSPRCRSYYG